MIPAKQSRYRRIESSGEAMSIHMDEKSSHTLSSTIYSHHRREEAVLREIGCNAYDGHLKAGREARPFKIILPTEGHSYLTFRDYGIGLTYEEGRRYLTGFFRSGSQYEEAPTGYYGLGAKSPFAYTDSYDVVVIREGRQSHFLFYKDEAGTPTHSLIARDEATREPDGVIFRIPVKPGDIDRFKRMAAYLFPLFRTFPDIENMRVDEKRAEAKAFFSRVMDFEGVEAVLCPEGSLPGFVAAHPSRGTVMLWMGNILYPMSIASWRKSDIIAHDSYLMKLLKLAEKAGVRIMIMAQLKDGITVEPGRERIITSRRNIAVVESYAERLYKAVYRRGKSQFQGMTNWQIARQASDDDRQASTSDKPPVDILALHLFCEFEFRMEAFTPLMDKFGVDLSVVSIKPQELMHSSKALERYIRHKQQGVRPRSIYGIFLQNRRATRIVDIVGHVLSEVAPESKPASMVRVDVLVVKARERHADLEGFAKAAFGDGEFLDDDRLSHAGVKGRQHVDQVARKNLTLWAFGQAGWAPTQRATSEREMVRRGIRAFGYSVYPYGPHQTLVMPKREVERQREVLEAFRRLVMPFHLVTYVDESRSLTVGVHSVKALVEANPQVASLLEAKWFRQRFLAALDDAIRTRSGRLIDSEITRTLATELVAQVRNSRDCGQFVDADLLSAFPDRLNLCLTATDINDSEAQWQEMRKLLDCAALIDGQGWRRLEGTVTLQAQAAAHFLHQVIALALDYPKELIAGFRVDTSLIERFRAEAMAGNIPSLRDELSDTVKIRFMEGKATPWDCQNAGERA